MPTNSGSGYGSGYGYGDGDGSGSGLGYGYGYGDGDGSGLGYGSGYGDGYGSGLGLGEVIATLGGHEVRVHPPFDVVSVGCQVHAVDEWQEQWREIADEHGVCVTHEQVDAVLATIHD